LWGAGNVSVFVLISARGRFLPWVKLAPLFQELLLSLFMRWVRDAAIVDRAYLGTARRFGYTDTLGALFQIDYINRLALANRLVFTFRLASAATDALIGNLIGHLSFLLVFHT